MSKIFFVFQALNFLCDVQLVSTTRPHVIGVSLCRPAFLYMNCIGKDRWRYVRKAYELEGGCPRTFKYRGRNKKAITYEDSCMIAKFLDNLADIHSLALPGRVPGYSVV